MVAIENRKIVLGSFWFAFFMISDRYICMNIEPTPILVGSRVIDTFQSSVSTFDELRFQ